MKNNWNKYIFIGLIFSWLNACKSSGDEFDATGVFETEEVIVSAESTGKLLNFVANEGDNLKANQVVAQIDCDNIGLQKGQVEASISALKMRQNEAGPQIQILAKQADNQRSMLNIQREQLRVFAKEKARLQKLVAAEAAPQKQLDDIEGQMDILQKQMESTQTQIALTNQQIVSQKAQVGIQNRGILSETQPLKMRVAQIDEQLSRCKLINPFDGTILVKYTQNQEVVAAGKPIYKIGNLNNMVLRAYIGGTQLGQVKVNQSVKVYIDNGKDTYKELPGTISWISSKSEFTPKTIQTKDERANLVYAAKINVKNDGFIKIGMYGEVKF